MDYNVRYKINIESTSATKGLEKLSEVSQQKIPKIISDLDVLRKKISKVNTALATFHKLSTKKPNPIKITLDNKINKQIENLKKEIDRLNRRKINVKANVKQTNTTGVSTGNVVTPVVTPQPRGNGKKGNNRAVRGFGNNARGMYGLYDVMYTAGFPFPNMIGAAAIGMGVRSVVTDYAEYENIMTTVESILHSTDKDLTSFNDRFNDMSKNIRQVGVDTKFTTTEVAGAAKYLAMAGLNIEDINNSMKPIANLAIITDAPLDRMADIVTNIQTAYGISSKFMPQIADILTSIATSSNTNVLEMGEAMKFAAPMMSMGGISFNEAAAAVGALANAGLKGTVAGTALRAMMQRLLKPTKQGIEVLKKYNIELYELDKNTGKTRLKSLFDIFSQLKDKNASVQDLIRIFDKIGGNAANNIFTELLKLPELVQNSINSGGIAERHSSKKQDTIKGKWDRVTSQFTETGMNIFDAYSPVIMNGLDRLVNILKEPGTAKLFSDIASGLMIITNLLFKVGDFITTYWKYIGPILLGGFLANKFNQMIQGLLSAVGVITNVIGAVRGLTSAIGIAGAVSGTGAVAGGAGLLGALTAIAPIIAVAVAALATFGIQYYTKISTIENATDNFIKKLKELKGEANSITSTNDNFVKNTFGFDQFSRNSLYREDEDKAIHSYAELQAEQNIQKLVENILTQPLGQKDYDFHTKMLEQQNVLKSMYKIGPVNTIPVEGGNIIGINWHQNPVTGNYVADRYEPINKDNILNTKEGQLGYNKGLDNFVPRQTALIELMTSLNKGVATQEQALKGIQAATFIDLNFDKFTTYETKKSQIQTAYQKLTEIGTPADNIRKIFNAYADKDDELQKIVNEVVPAKLLYANKDVRMDTDLDAMMPGASGSSGGSGSGLSGVGSYKGQTPKQIIVNIDNLIETFTMNYNGPEDKEQMKNLVCETIVEAIQDAEISLASNYFS